MKDTATLLLKKHWGYGSLRETQQRAIESIMSGRDTMVIMPTGGGKSLCYQLPALMCEGIVIVVSPLIALMEDQVKTLNRRGIKARYINSTLSRENISQYLNEAIEGKLRLLYITPERIHTESFSSAAEWLNVAFIAIDEAHCISMWGHDFRPSYREVATMREYFPQAPMMALTATATPSVVNDIASSLGFEERYEKIVQPFRRENLSYEVEFSHHKYNRLIELLTSCTGSAIVYCSSKNTIGELAVMLDKNGMSVTQYHASLSTAVRQAALNDWLTGKKKVMIATSAFGMGIDKADVRMVIHWHIPPTVEDYFQQAGRAGRDGLPARAILLADEKAFSMLEYTISTAESADELMALYTRLCNYMGVGYGDWPSTPARFSFDEFCSSYNITDRNRTRILFSYLVRYGVIAFYGNERHSSRAMIKCNIDECYQMKENSYTRILESLVRSSDGIFSYMVTIDVEKCAAGASMTVEEFCSQMERLKMMGIVDWEKEGSYSYLYYTRTRDDESILSHLRYNVKLSADIRHRGIEKIKEYIHTRECRARWIEAYFGMNEGIECCLCDNCLKTSER
ncbi:MAG: ATP-dependent DNA helicase RecQ [Flavobacteriales bacterium]|nr:ATP-dependent DNA helicase RecQ [Flavobacteriales bacterium]